MSSTTSPRAIHLNTSGHHPQAPPTPTSLILSPPSHPSDHVVRHVTSTWHVLSKVGADDGASHPGDGAQLEARGCVLKAEYGLSEAVDVSRKQERVSLKQRSVSSKHTSHPRGNQWAHLNAIFHRCYLREVIFEWKLTIETIYLPMGGLQGGVSEQKRC